MRATFLFLLTGCTQAVELDPITVLGDGNHDVSDRLELIAGPQDGLARPTDLAFNPDRPGELWVVNRRTDSTTILFDAGTPQQRSEHRVDPYALHFMEQVTSIAFGAPGTFGTCQDGDNTYNGTAPGDAFTGPTLWPSDLDVYAQSNPEAVQALSEQWHTHVDLGSHLDMLHESPECMGIAWDHDNVYWVFDGYNGAIARYDFHVDHGPGWDDHSDGTIAKWVSGEVRRLPGVVSHLELDPRSGLLYVADSGNQRVAVLDTLTGERGADLERAEVGTDHHTWVDADFRTLVDGRRWGMGAPSGLARVGDVLFVTDPATSRIYAFDLEGNPLDWADTGLPSGSLAGIHATSLDELWLVDQAGNTVYRLEG